jgi:4-hydroxy-tetrahydrodipicolinate reductase
MNIAIIGYGKMGKTIEGIAKERGHTIIYASNEMLLSAREIERADVAIEFTQPESAVDNILLCAEAGIPIVSGTTGWLSRWDQVCREVNKFHGSFFYASNFSLGVNLFFQLNRKLAKMMATHSNYAASITEIHHVHKKDAPSGTAITLAEDIIDQHPGYTKWNLGKALENDSLAIEDIREGEVPGTHIIRYTSEHDKIQIEHEAFGRMGFATGAVVAAEWLPGKTGIWGMKDLLNTDQ